MNLFCFGEELEVQEKPERLLHGWACFGSRQGFPGRDRVSGPVLRQGFPYVATWFSSCRQLLGREIVFPCRDRALFLCRDDVKTEVSMSQSRRP